MFPSNAQGIIDNLRMIYGPFWMFYHLDSLLHPQRWRETRKETVRRRALLSAFAPTPCLSPTRMVLNVLHCGNICFLHTLSRAVLEVCKIHALGVGVERDVSEVILEGTKCFLIPTAPWSLRPPLYQLHGEQEQHQQAEVLSGP